MPKPDSNTAAFFLVGPTAVGKSAVAHHIAAAEGRAVLSADAFLVYRGMDIGTAKPTAAERKQVRYGGIDLVDPDRPFSVGAWLASAHDFLSDLKAAERPAIVAGGTGLYVKCLTEGLRATAADPARRAEAEAILRAGGTSALQAELRRCAPAAYRALVDPHNPRRLVRAYELALQEETARDRWTGPPDAPLVGLRMDPRALAGRIQRRVERMYEEGLLDEVRHLQTAFPAFSATAARAIGYAEAADALAGLCTVSEAMERSVRRTRQFARRQGTWFRHQARVVWIEVSPEMSIEECAAEVRAAWREHGPTPISQV